MTQLELFAPSTLTALRAVIAAEVAWYRAQAIRAVRRHLGHGAWGERVVDSSPRVEREASVWRRP